MDNTTGFTSVCLQFVYNDIYNLYIVYLTCHYLVYHCKYYIYAQLYMDRGNPIIACNNLYRNVGIIYIYIYI